jgi:hypothetical protein
MFINVLDGGKGFGFVARGEVNVRGTVVGELEDGFFP